MHIDLPGVEAFTDDSRELLKGFLKSIDDKTIFETSGRDHMKTLCLVHACIESAKTGKRVQMDEFCQRHNIPSDWTSHKGNLAGTSKKELEHLETGS